MDEDRHRPTRAGDVRDQVKKGLSEVRTTVLGGQILLGFQYEALFQPGFEALSPLCKTLDLVACGLLLLAIVCMIAPAAFHQLSEQGRSTTLQRRFTRLLIALSLAPFAVAIGIDLFVVMGAELGGAAAVTLAVCAVLMAALLWFGIEIMATKSGGTTSPSTVSEGVSLKDRVSDLMTETRIVLPGVQALLGFQFAAYLSPAFARLPPAGRAAHDVGLILLLASMIFLMTPAPFHRLAEDGRETTRLCRLTVTMIVLALAALALGLAADVYVTTLVVTRSGQAALSASLAAAALGLVIWFACPLLARRRTVNRSSRCEKGARHA